MGLKKAFFLPDDTLIQTHTAALVGNTSQGNLSTAPPPNASTPLPAPSIITLPPCQWILYEDINDSHVRIWDLMILIPNVIFAIFMLLRIRTALQKLGTTGSPIFTAFYTLVWVICIIGVIRAVIAMIVSHHNIADKILWLVLRFFLLATEMSVVIFGLLFGHLDSRTSIRRVLAITCFLAAIYSITQGVLEFHYHDKKYYLEGENYDIFAHGGMIFLCASAAFFLVVYITVLVLPYTPLKDKLNLPSKKSFYIYCGILALLNLGEVIGSAALEMGAIEGMCVVDVAAYLYFSMFAPLVFCTFLWKFFGTPRLNLLFSYKSHMDEGGVEDDQVSLPYQTPRIDASMTSGYDSTPFDTNSATGSGEEDFDIGPSKNPLYDHSEDFTVLDSGDYSINADIPSGFEASKAELT
ncbi:transmembrane protein adipocyte-associated 1 homolog [Lingula anatina]|uniref:Transmembrane protein adipocyte-associated 1 homolog n=1 Tax=Lingula anatina TaxID=7574 RepID=A0A1S3JSI0_LINAN|nr:transmembrane protein adipocyte-associated 1 homolog [Lingula anatina]XP_013412974.1 transmembrane protein adipocyte-associated 1 homolog [Lingula anatina]|eukprot:XP_013412973.1 transmembrane protein adipocyte-associated 1 homolog [Lingula anatina]